MQPLLPENTISKQYRRFTVPSTPVPADNKKLEFFYIGKKSAVIDKLINIFESGYAAESPEHARTMLKRLSFHSNSAPAFIIAESAVGHAALLLFYQFISSQPLLANVPLLIEGSDISEMELQKFRNEPFADDIINLNELNADQFLVKVNFWKKVKQRIGSLQENHFNEDFSPVQNSPADFSKRTFDIVISSFLMVLLSPVFLLIYIALRIQSKGPVFYTSKRAGKGYKIFNFYKFRTMNVEANENLGEFSHLNLYSPLNPDGPVFIKIDNDPRITPLGSLLRKCSVDELPQLWNVFKGDMSLVGNRPLPLYEASTLTTDEWAKRFMAPAGITGLWQIKKKSQNRMTAEERISLDINYADKSTFLFDLWIMANTPNAVIQRTNA